MIRIINGGNRSKYNIRDKNITIIYNIYYNDTTVKLKYQFSFFFII